LSLKRSLFLRELFSVARVEKLLKKTSIYVGELRTDEKPGL
jgi:hypothetical protein